MAGNGNSGETQGANRSGGVEFVALEHQVLKFWEENHSFEKLREKNAGGPIFRFLDGPITANNPMGVHHAWGRTLKDVFIRYKTLTGHDTHWQNGFDSQGLWVEVEVEKELGFKDKSEIEKAGLENFVQACKDRVTKYSAKQTEQSIRLGQWMDWPNSYYTHTDENIQGIWTFLKTCSDNGWLYTDKRAMSWCTRCGTSLSEHEMSGSYRDLTHRSVIVALPLLEKPGTRMLVWTTTPWTLAANCALAVNPDIEYAEISVEGAEGKFIIGKDALGSIEHVKKKVERIFKGEELVGQPYETVFHTLPKQVEAGVHKVVAWDEVDAEEGTGVVHIAPGCGAEDYELGKSLGIAILEPIDEAGDYVEGYGWLTGKDASTVADEVIEEIDKSGKLFHDHDYTHSYPICWRCKTPIMFKLVDAWFINTSEVKPKLIEASANVDWHPKHAGALMQDWLTNMGDWNISRKRFYGMPLPFYVCKDCGEVTVISNREELKAHADDPAKVDALPELHRPWIDDITITCPKCKASGVKRIVEVGDVWLDAGIVPYTTRGYFSNREEWEEKWYPIEWICEMREQVRLWFYSMLFMGVTLSGRAPYERVLAYESVVSEEGNRFSKTGFMIQFDEAADKIGADSMRYLYCAANPTANVRFGYNLGTEVHRKLLGFWNIYKFFTTYAELDKVDLTGVKIDESALTRSDRWALARTERLLKIATEGYEDYNTPVVMREFESFIDELSNFYIRVNRRRFWRDTDETSKQTAYAVLSRALKTSIQVLAPVIPFLTEHMWQEGVRLFDKNVEESVHLADWPTGGGFVNDELLGEVEMVREVIRGVLNLRNQVQIKIRQPLPTLHVICETELAEMIGRDLETIKDEVNVKAIEFTQDHESLEEDALMVDLVAAGRVLRGDAPKAKAALDNATPEQMTEWTAKVNAGEAVELPGVDSAVPADLFKTMKRPVSYLAVGDVENAPVQVALDTRISDELAREGLVRDLIRRVQVLRKDSGLEVEDRIQLAVKSRSEEIASALEEHGGFVQDETLAESLEVGGSIADAAGEESLKLGGSEVTIQIKKA